MTGTIDRKVMFTLNPKIVTLFLAKIAGLLISLHLIVWFFGLALNRWRLLGLTSLFSLDGEANFPAFYSSFILLFSSVLLFFIAAGKKNLMNLIFIGRY